MAPKMLPDAGQLVKRAEHTSSHGVLDPHDINNVGFFVLFALIGVGFVLTGIWFFFWAKNGGFHFREKDWDDYKSTVLRRKGPNGTLLSGATASTDLGGGSVYKDVLEEDDASRTVVTESMTALSGITAGASDIAARKKRREKEQRRRRERQEKMRRREQSHNGTDRGKRRVGNGGGVLDEEAERKAQKELRSYRHEKPARVGGLNKQAEGSNPSEASTSEVLSSRQASSRHKSSDKGSDKGKIRKVYSTDDHVSDRETERETQRVRSEARRLREESRNRKCEESRNRKREESRNQDREESRNRDREQGRVLRRDFSYQRPGNHESAQSESLLEGSDLGTKTYHHPMPELWERERRRSRRHGGYRRGRVGDDLE